MEIQWIINGNSMGVGESGRRELRAEGRGRRAESRGQRAEGRGRSDGNERIEKGELTS
jgi:hypothetical protein